MKNIRKMIGITLCISMLSVNLLGSSMSVFAADVSEGIGQQELDNEGIGEDGFAEPDGNEEVPPSKEINPSEAAEDAAEASAYSESGEEEDSGLQAEAQNGEKKENSWRYQDGSLIPEVETYATSSNAWKKVNGVYVNSIGEEIPGAVKKGIDVSEHQKVIDWDAVKADGIDYAIIRCGYGNNESSQDDKYWLRNVSECERLGIPYGVYIYSYATTVANAKSEAQHVLRLIQGHNLSYPVYFDMEDKSTVNTSSDLKGQMAKAFCDTITAAGYKAGVYANLNWWNTYLTSPVFDNASWSKWVAQYNTTCDYSGSYDMWQCTSSGKVNGISGGVDVNFWIDFNYLPYGDVKKGSWYYDAVAYMYHNGYMTGLSPTSFGPTSRLSRAQFTTILYRMSGSPQVTYTSTFSDVAEGTFYTDAVLWANNAGIVTGYGNGVFSPAKNISREEMATILFRYAQHNGYDTSSQGDLNQFSDGNKVAGFAIEGVKWTVGMGIISGNADGTLAPKNAADRAACAVIMMRYKTLLGN